ncbi:MAG: helix-turn-helix domain-containing protein [Clostridia bacterium]|nr:helix-turn-helix domain-containing protein [Clostridia bacterium]
MRKKLNINENHMPYEELKAVYNKCTDAKIKIKLLAILQTWDGQTSLQVAANLHKSDATVRLWIHRYNENSVHGLYSKTHSNRKSYLSPDQKQILQEILIHSPRECGLDRDIWSMRLLAQWIRENFRIEYHPGSLYKLVYSMGYTKQSLKHKRNDLDIKLQKKYEKENNGIFDTNEPDTVFYKEVKPA